MRFFGHRAASRAPLKENLRLRPGAGRGIIEKSFNRPICFTLETSMALNVVEIWRDLHKTPELGFEENKTSAYLAEALEKLGYAVTRGVGKTGVMGVIRGAEHGPVLMLRADMDALPFRNDDGSIEAVHACGHDSHCAMVLAAASELAGRVRRGTLKILFQPGEETLHGALEVLKSGAVDDVDIALGCHVRPIQDIPTGTCAAAVRHTSSTFADIVIHGRTAHASRPHLGVNCAEVAAAVTQAVAAIKGDPAKVWSCKVTSIQACAAAVNIIPDTATLKLDIRAQTNELMDELLEKVRMAAAGTAAAYGATAEVILPGVVIPAAVYDEDLVAELAGTIREVLGDECLARDCGGGGEDFHFFKKERPHIRAAYFDVGAGCTPGLHARNMTFDETQLDMGVRVLTAAALKHVG